MFSLHFLRSHVLFCKNKYTLNAKPVTISVYDWCVYTHYLTPRASHSAHTDTSSTYKMPKRAASGVGLEHGGRRQGARRRLRYSRVQRPMTLRGIDKVRNLHINELATSSLSQGSFYDLAAIPEGSGPLERIGNVIHVQGFKFRGIIHNHNTGEGLCIRMAIIKTPIDGNFTNSTEMFRNLSNGDGQVSTNNLQGLQCIYAPFSPQVCTVVSDKTFVLGRNNGDASNCTQQFSTDLMFKYPVEIKYQGTNTSGPVKYPRFHLCVWCAESDDDVATGLTAEFHLSGTTHFYDG